MRFQSLLDRRERGEIMHAGLYRDTHAVARECARLGGDEGQPPHDLVVTS
jgi:hypothetical protein